MTESKFEFLDEFGSSNMQISWKRKQRQLHYYKEEEDDQLAVFILGQQMLGCCTLEQLKYFYKQTKNHKMGAKDRVLYLTYLGLCKKFILMNLLIQKILNSVLGVC